MEKLIANHIEVVHEADGTGLDPTDAPFQSAEQPVITQPGKRAAGDPGCRYRRVACEVERFDLLNSKELVLVNGAKDSEVAVAQPARQLLNVARCHALLAT